MRSVIGNLVKRAVNGAVFLLAAYAFFTVPLGGKTGAQHMVAIFTTPPARQAGQAIADAAKRLESQVLHEVDDARKRVAEDGPDGKDAKR